MPGDGQHLRLAELLAQRQQRELFATINAQFDRAQKLRLEGWQDARTVGVDPAGPWGVAASMSNPADETLEDFSNSSAAEAWVAELLAKDGFSSTFWLSMGIGLPWARIEILAESGWLAELWVVTGEVDFVALRDEKDRWIAFFEDHDRLGAILRDVPNVQHQDPTSALTPVRL